MFLLIAISFDNELNFAKSPLFPVYSLVIHSLNFIKIQSSYLFYLNYYFSLEYNLNKYTLFPLPEFPSSTRDLIYYYFIFMNSSNI